MQMSEKGTEYEGSHRSPGNDAWFEDFIARNQAFGCRPRRAGATFFALAPVCFGADASFSPAIDFPTGTNPRSVTTADFNGDGDRRPRRRQLPLRHRLRPHRRRRGRLRARRPTSRPATAPCSVTAADFNGDGAPRPRRRQRRLQQRVRPPRRRPAGGFGAEDRLPDRSRRRTRSPRPTSTATGDADLAVANSTPTASPSSSATARGLRAETDFPTGATASRSPRPTSTATGDPDLAVANYTSNTSPSSSATQAGGFGASRLPDRSRRRTRSPRPTSTATATPTSPSPTPASGSTVSVLLGDGRGRFGPKTDFHRRRPVLGHRGRLQRRRRTPTSPSPPAPTASPSSSATRAGASGRRLTSRPETAHTRSPRPTSTATGTPTSPSPTTTPPRSPSSSLKVPPRSRSTPVPEPDRRQHSDLRLHRRGRRQPSSARSTRARPTSTSCSDASSHTPAQPLADGEYTFRVRPTDGAANQTAETRNFSVDRLEDRLGPLGPNRRQHSDLRLHRRGRRQRRVLDRPGHAQLHELLGRLVPHPRPAPRRRRVHLPGPGNRRRRLSGDRDPHLRRQRRACALDRLRPLGPNRRQHPDLRLHGRGRRQRRVLDRRRHA